MAALDRQLARIAEWAAVNGTHIARYVRETGSGLNDKRRELVALLADPAVAPIAVEHRDRLARFGVAQLDKTLAASTLRGTSPRRTRNVVPQVGSAVALASETLRPDA